jgi:DNA-binding transcriptional LysR family regulator
MDALTLDQFTVFITIVEEGSFAATARRLGRAQSAVTYAIQKLEDQCGVILFDRSAYRPVLTKAGHALLPRIRRIVDDVGEFRLQASGMATGVEAELTLVIDSFMPLSLAIPALRDFHEAYPMVQLRIIADWTKDAIQDVMEDRADLGIFPEAFSLPPELARFSIGEIDLVAVAEPSHPLASIPHRISLDELRGYLQIVVSNPKASLSARSYGVIGINQWHVSNSQLRHNLIVAGLGWGSLPRPMAAEDLEKGNLVELDPEQWDSRDHMPRFRLNVVKRKDKAFGPAATWLLKRMSENTDNLADT